MTKSTRTESVLPETKSPHGRRLRIISNVWALERLGDEELELLKYPNNPLSLFGMIKMYFRTYRYDYLLIDGLSKQVLIYGLLKRILPFNRCRFVSMDQVLRKPDNLRGKILAIARKIAHASYSLHIEYFKNTASYERYFGMKPHKFRYVPFKVNSLEQVKLANPRDSGYIYSGGHSLRDFPTLIEAVRGIDVPVKIMTSDDEALVRNCSKPLRNVVTPENVTVIRDCYDQDGFIDCIAGAKLVVLPIMRDSIAASGISVYLMAMALEKCVIISRGPGAEDVLTNGQAIFVPPEDVNALREAILITLGDPGRREKVARRAKAYAWGLGGVMGLAQSVAEVLKQDFADNL